jgi:gliding motility-associated-like protein
MFYVLLAHSVFAQLSGTGCLGETNYTDGQPNDPVYYYPVGQLGELTVVPEVAGSSFNFVWYRYTPGNLTWASYLTQNNQPTSTISNLQPGAYFVSIRNTANAIVGCYRAWIVRVLQEPVVEVQPIAPGCSGPISLVGTYTPGQISPISNLPESQMFINANTEITVCFSGTHTWVSDLAFYLRGPASCGNVNLLLMPNPGALGLGNCNMGDNLNNLCFSTESTNNLNVCTAAAPLTGTYGRYGPASTPINWAPLNGCDAMNGGWAVQIYDCVGLDVGTLTDATITFTGFDLCGAPQTVTYTTPNNFSSAINDNSCSAATASIFNVAPAAAPASLNCPFGFEWTSDPPVNIPNATTSLNINLNALTDASGNPVAWQDIDFTLSATFNCDEIAENNNCFGGNWSDTETFIYTPSTAITISDIPPVCANAGNVQLTADVPGGTWSGVGITDAALGTFDPALAIPGPAVVSYSSSNSCYSPDQTTIDIIPEPTIAIGTPAIACPGSPITLAATASSGTIEWLDEDGNVLGMGSSIDVTYDVSTSLEAVITDECLITTSATVSVPYEVIPSIETIISGVLCAGSTTQLEAEITGNYNTIEWTTTNGLIDGPFDTPVIDIQAEGTYTTTITTALGCNYSDAVLVESSPLPVLAVSGDADVCAGDSHNLSVSGAETYEWSPSDYLSADDISNPVVDLEQTTTYTVQGYSADGCVSDAAVTLTYIDYPTVSVLAPLMACPQTNVTLNATGTPGTWEWTLEDGTVLGGGDQIDVQFGSTTNVLVEVTDACMNTSSATVSVSYEELTSVETESTVIICEGDATQLEATIIGNYVSVEWTTIDGLINGTTDSPTINTQTEGTYSATVTTALGCEYTDAVVVEPSPLPVLVTSSDSDVCAGDLYNLSVSGAQTYQWSPSDYLSADDIANPIVNLQQTTTYTVQGISNEGCVSNATITLTYIDYPTVSVVSPAVACPETIVTLNATGTPGTWEWTFDNGTVIGAGNQIDVQLSTTTNVNVEVTDACLNTATATVEVQYEPIPGVDAGGDEILCIGSDVTLEATVNGGFVSLNWSTLDGTIIGPANMPEIETSDEGTYTVTITTPLNCTYSDDVFVDVVPLPAVNAGSNDVICALQPYALNANGAVSYSWWPVTGLSNSLIASPQATISAPITYTVTGTDANGCVNSDQVELTLIPQPQVFASPVSIICPQEDVTLSVNGTAGIVEWTPSNYLTSVVGYSVVASPWATTTYTATLTDVCGVQATAQIVVPVEELYTVSAGPDVAFCEGLSAQLQAEVNGANPTLEWLDPDGITLSDISETPVVSIPGLYLLNVETPLGCQYQDDVLIVENDYPVFNLAETFYYCQGESVGATILGNWDLIEWSNGDLGSSSTFNSEGIYEVSVTENNCSTTDDFTVEEVILPIIELGPSIEICADETATIDAGYTGEWNTGTNSSSITVSNPGTYVFEYSQQGCSIMDEVSVFVKPLPFVRASSTQYGCMNNEYIISIDDYSEGSYLWSDGTSDTYLVVDQPGSYWFMVTNDCGSVVQTVDVVFEDCDMAVYIPNSFTPDNDGVNDVWKIEARNIKSLKTKVFNRWGQVVFESNDLSPVWTGGFNSGDTYVPDGMYFFRIEAEKLDGQNALREGSMFIIR